MTSPLGLGPSIVKNPQVTVYVKEYNSQHVTITGAVNKPGVYPIKGSTSLMQVVAMAGGFGDDTDSTVLVLRERDGKRSAAKFDVSAIQKGTAEDPPLQSGDDIIAGTSAIKRGFQYHLESLAPRWCVRMAVNDASMQPELALANERPS